MATINLGRVGFVNKGTYSGATAYKVNDVVVYNSGTYACIQANTGQLPTATAYWQVWVANDKALDSAVVHKTGNETIAGVKTFTANPTSSNATEANIALEKTGTGASVFYPYNGATQLGLADTVIGIIAYINKTLATDFIINKNLYVVGSILSTAGIGIGYGTGSGGTVTQLTSKSTAVTLNKPCGQITMHNAALGAGASVTFVVNNSLVAYIDNAVVTIAGGTGGYSNNRVQATCYGGGIAITVTNQTAGSLSEALVLNFTVIKGAIA